MCCKQKAPICRRTARHSVSASARPSYRRNSVKIHKVDSRQRCISSRYDGLASNRAPDWNIDACSSSATGGLNHSPNDRQQLQHAMCSAMQQPHRQQVRESKAIMPKGNKQQTKHNRPACNQQSCAVSPGDSKQCAALPTTPPRQSRAQASLQAHNQSIETATRQVPTCARAHNACLRQHPEQPTTACQDIAPQAWLVHKHRG